MSENYNKKPRLGEARDNVKQCLEQFKQVNTNMTKISESFNEIDNNYTSIAFR